MKNNLKSYAYSSKMMVNSHLEIKKKSVSLSFTLQGVLAEYSFEETKNRQRANELWRTTCFELFLASRENEDYYELNFSSSLAWNLYHLSSYRADVQEVQVLSEPTIRINKQENQFQICLELELEELCLEQFNLYNVASILLTKENERTFWSVKHEKDVPDFHHRSNFLKIT